MAGIEETLLRTFDGLFPKSAGADAVNSLAEAARQLSQAAAQSMPTAAATTAGSNTRGSSPAPGSNSPGVGATIGSIAETVLEGGLGVVPLISGLAGLFGGGDSEAPPPLTKYVMPSAISFQSAESGGRLVASDSDQTGAPRRYEPQPDGIGPAAAPAPQITVNVQAMDARSFMDYSGEIAQAVRGAMLNLSSLNDVVNDL